LTPNQVHHQKCGGIRFTWGDFEQRVRELKDRFPPLSSGQDVLRNSLMYYFSEDSINHT
jgi:hypothetical protein